ncbi:MAG TPA: hypothetical protein VEU07_11035 [Candidatus Acidoferrum sp.]|nr:hypothetical protein [Candidatus Acidoferrum sp.]
MDPIRESGQRITISGGCDDTVSMRGEEPGLRRADALARAE